MYLKVCEQCGARFKTENKKRKFCSSKCAHESQMKRVYRICEFCGKTYFVRESQKNRKKKFCSKECRRKALTIEKVCEECGKKFTVLRYRKSQKYCSRKCKYAHVRRVNSLKSKAELSQQYGRYSAENARRPEVRLKISLSKLGRKNPNWKTPIIVKCDWCGKEFEVKPRRVKNRKHIFCSRECAYKWTAKRMRHNNPMKNKALRRKAAETWKRKYREEEEFRKRILESRSRHPNNFEKKFIKFVKAHNLPFKFVGDFSFWIGPCKSGKSRNPDFIHKHGRKTAILVGAKYHHLMSWKQELEDYKSVGWKAIYIWQDEFESSKELILQKINELLGGLEVYAMAKNS